MRAAGRGGRDARVRLKWGERSMRVKRLWLRGRFALACLAASVLAIGLAGVLGTTPVNAFGYSRSALADAVDRTAADSALAVAPPGGEPPLAPGKLRQLQYLADTTDAETPLI